MMLHSSDTETTLRLLLVCSSVCAAALVVYKTHGSFSEGAWLASKQVVPTMVHSFPMCLFVPRLQLRTPG